MTDDTAQSALRAQIGRTKKPRTEGITIVIDTGLGPNRIDDMVSVAGPYVDYVKLAWVSSLILPDLAGKLEHLRRHGLQPLLGGSLFEYAYLWGRLDQLVGLVREAGCAIEVSDGVVSIPRREKLAWIEKLAALGEVFSELGGKPESHDLDWTQCVREELSAGSGHVVIEGREIGPTGKDIRTDLVDAILAATEPRNLVFEALERYQQVWMIKRFGPNVNLGNIRADDLVAVECYRQGLKEQTMLEFRRRFGPATD